MNVGQEYYTRCHKMDSHGNQAEPSHICRQGLYYGTKVKTLIPNRFLYQCCGYLMAFIPATEISTQKGTVISFQNKLLPSSGLFMLWTIIPRRVP